MSTKVMSTDANNNTDSIIEKLETCTLTDETPVELISGDANNNKLPPSNDNDHGDASQDVIKNRPTMVSQTSDLKTIKEARAENDEIEHISDGDDDAFEESEPNNPETTTSTTTIAKDETSPIAEIASNVAKLPDFGGMTEAEIAEIPEVQPAVDEDGCHPLERKWTWWFLNGDKPKNNDKNKGRDMGSEWNHGLLQVYEFHTVEDFWAVFNHMQSPAKLRLKNDYMVFQSGVRPEWEDVHNQGGGMWKIILPSKMRAEHLDRLWIEILLSMIGESYGELGNFICGAYLQRRQKEDRIQLWTTRGSPEELTELGKILKTRLNLDKDSQIHYLLHQNQYGDGGPAVGGGGAVGGGAGKQGMQHKHMSWSRKHKNGALYTV